MPTWYVTVTTNSGTAPSGPGALATTATTPVWQWTQAVVGTMVANCTARFYSDAAGTNQVGRLDFTVSAQRTS